MSVICLKGVWGLRTGLTEMYYAKRMSWRKTQKSFVFEKNGSCKEVHFASSHDWISLANIAIWILRQITFKFMNNRTCFQKVHCFSKKASYFMVWFWREALVTRFSTINPFRADVPNYLKFSDILESIAASRSICQNDLNSRISSHMIYKHSKKTVKVKYTGKNFLKKRR